MQRLSLWLQALTWLHPTSLQQCCFTLHEGEYKVNTEELLHWQSSKNVSITSLSSVMSTECGTGTSSERWNRIQSAYYAHQKLAHNLTFMESWVLYMWDSRTMYRPDLVASKLHQYIAYLCSQHSNNYHISGQCDLQEICSSYPQVHWPSSTKLAFPCHSMPAVLPFCVPQCICSPVLWTAALQREPPDTIQDSTSLSHLVAHWPNLSGLLQCKCESQQKFIYSETLLVPNIK